MYALVLSDIITCIDSFGEAFVNVGEGAGQGL
jgi:hypothetical protein